MGNFQSREELLGASVKTTEVDAFGSTVMVSELPAALVQKWFAGGMLNLDGDEPQVDLSKLDFVEIALKTLVDPNDSTKLLLLPQDQLKLSRKAFGDIQKVAMAAIEISDLGGTKEEEEAKN